MTVSSATDRRDGRSVDALALKRQASGHWPAMIPHLSGVSPEILDGQHYPCPKRGCKARRDGFRVFGDFTETGAMLCNQCFNEGNGDGLAALQWLNNWDFPTTLKAVADYLGEAPRKAPVPRTKPKAPPFDDQVAWLPESDTDAILAKWVTHKPPVTVETARTAGARICRFYKSDPDPIPCVAFPAYQGTEPCAWLLYRVDGDDFPPRGKLKERKTHLLAGSADGWTFPGGREHFEACERFVRVEGIGDGMALSPMLPEGWAVVSNVCGAKSVPSVDIFRGKTAGIGIGDADIPGQEGLQKFAKAVYPIVPDFRLAQLPYEIADHNGQDVRDFLNEDGDFEALEAMAEPFEPGSVNATPRRPDGPAITNATVRHTDDGNEVYPKPMGEIIADVHEATDNWPRLANGALFIDNGGTVTWLEKSAAMFGWLGSHTGRPPQFVNHSGVHSRGEVFEELKRVGIRYDAIETFPHYPPVPGLYYACNVPEPGDGRTLEELVGRFNPESDIDADLIKTAFVTAVWGGRPGARPCFVITSSDGRGAGKSTLIHMVGHFAGGLVEVSPQEDASKLKTRLLSPEALTKRVILLDNVKSLRFSWGELEGLVTATTISGHRMYVGETQRPNTLLWAITLNGVSLATDLAQRAVVIKVRKPTYSGDWAEDCRDFINDHRQALIGDCIAFLRSERSPLPKYSRWGAWEREILERLPEPADAQRVILERQAESNAEAEEAQAIEDFFGDELRKVGYQIDEVKVFIPSRVAHRWVKEVTSDSTIGQSKSTRYLKQQIEEGALTRLIPSPSRAHGRGFVWQGEKACGESVNADLENRMERWR